MPHSNKHTVSYSVLSFTVRRTSTLSSNVTSDCFHLAEYHFNLFRRFRYLPSHIQWFHKEFLSHISIYRDLVEWSLKLFCFFKHVLYCGLYTAFQRLEFCKEFCKDTFTKMQFVNLVIFKCVKPLENNNQDFSLMLCICIMCLAAQNNTGYCSKDMHYRSTYAPCAASSYDVALSWVFRSTLHIFRTPLLIQTYLRGSKSWPD